jgi:hypothetical protein
VLLFCLLQGLNILEMCGVAWCGLCHGGCMTIGVVWVLLKSFGNGGVQ